MLIDVRAAAVSFPDLLQTRGLYQFKPELPFVPGAEVAGEVIQAPADSGLAPGQRVAAFIALGGMAERAVASPFMTFALSDALDFGQGAALILTTTPPTSRCVSAAGSHPASRCSPRRRWGGGDRRAAGGPRPRCAHHRRRLYR